ncbi:adenine deaminase [Eubacteriales bacterium KG127]
MDKNKLKNLIDVAAGRKEADILIQNCKIVDVFLGEVSEGSIAITDGIIAGVGEYKAREVIDAKGAFASPGLIDSHIHIESSYLSPEELGKLLVPHGGTTIIADPHEIVNVCGFEGLEYMIDAAKNTKLDIKYMLPSCVPATAFENSGAVIDAEEMKKYINHEAILGIGEFMNFPGVIVGEDEDIDKLMLSKEACKPVDGHAPGIEGKALNAYVSTGIVADHECASIEEMRNKISCGMYVMLREGSACKDLKRLVKGITPQNARRCILCSDDRQPRTILHEGHLDNHLRMCTAEGVDAIEVIRMATINACECFGIKDRGAIAPGYRADIVLFDNLSEFNVEKVWINGELCSDKGEYLPEIRKHSIASVKGSVHIADFSEKNLKMNLKSEKVNVIEILPGGVVTKKAKAKVQISPDGDFVRNPDVDIVKISVVERHNAIGNVANGLLGGYGIKEGAIAVTIAHDSHNIIVVGANDEDMGVAITELAKQEGGIVLVKGAKVIERMPMPIAGLMSDQSGEWVDEKLESIHKVAHEVLGVNPIVEPVMTLTFMSLAVIPEIKLTDMGLFDVTKFEFIPIEAE